MNLPFPEHEVETLFQQTVARLAVLMELKDQGYISIGEANSGRDLILHSLATGVSE